jgi:hypothetical protein
MRRTHLRPGVPVARSFRRRDHAAISSLANPSAGRRFQWVQFGMQAIGGEEPRRRRIAGTSTYGSHINRSMLPPHCFRSRSLHDPFLGLP